MNLSNLLTALLCLSTVTGCGSSNAALPIDLSEIGELKLPKLENLNTETSPAQEPIQLPNPERVNPFQVVDKPEFARTSLPMQLKGFVESDRPKAVLLIGERISIVQEDDVVGSFRILKIKPPELVFDQNGVEHRLAL